MTIPVSSMKSYFPVKSTASSSPIPSSQCCEPGDGFTEKERQISYPALDPWRTKHEYSLVSISQIKPGSQQVFFSGKVVNIYDCRLGDKRPMSAKGCLKTVVCDGTDLILVTIWYSTATYTLTLGTLVTVYTTHISPNRPNTHSRNGSRKIGSGCNTLGPPQIAAEPHKLTTNIFPERDRGCYVRIHPKGPSSPPSPPSSNRLYAGLDTLAGEGHHRNTLLSSSRGEPPINLISLKSFLNGGNEIPGVKLLVYVKSIVVQTHSSGTSATSTNSGASPPATSTSTILSEESKPGRTVLRLADRSLPANAPNSTVSLVLFPPASACTLDFAVHRTILLLTSPTLRPPSDNKHYASSRPTLTLNSSSAVHIDPDLPLAHALRRHAILQGHLTDPNPPVPASVAVVLPALSAAASFSFPSYQRHPVHNLATLAAAIRSHNARDSHTPVPPPRQQLLTARLPLLVTTAPVLKFLRRGMLFCASRASCCGGEAAYTSSPPPPPPPPPPLLSMAPGSAPTLSLSRCDLCGRASRGETRLNPAVLGPLVDETGQVQAGEGVVFTDEAWGQLFGVAGVGELGYPPTAPMATAAEAEMGRDWEEVERVGRKEAEERAGAVQRRVEWSRVVLWVVWRYLDDEDDGEVVGSGEWETDDGGRRGRLYVWKVEDI